MSQKITKLVIIALISTLWQPAQQAGSFKGCVSIKQSGKCSYCYLRKMDASNGGCGSVVPASNPCKLYSFNIDGSGRSSCVGCKRGYYLNVTKPEGQRCIPSTFSQQCITAQVNFVVNKPECLKCDHGYLRPDKPGCIPASQVKNADPNCIWGGLYTRCFRCKDGYSVPEFGYGCHPYKKGCVFFNKSTKKCVFCDVYEGYYASPSRPGVCTNSEILE